MWKWFLASHILCGMSGAAIGYGEPVGAAVFAVIALLAVYIGSTQAKR